PASSGYSHFFVHPRTAGPLTSATASYRSVRGDIRTQWSLDGDNVHLSITIPANTTATVFVPATQESDIRESGRELAVSDGVRLLRREPGSAVLDVASGTYEFTSRR